LPFKKIEMNFVNVAFDIDDINHHLFEIFIRARQNRYFDSDSYKKLFAFANSGLRHDDSISRLNGHEG